MKKVALSYIVTSHYSAIREVWAPGLGLLAPKDGSLLWSEVPMRLCVCGVCRRVWMGSLPPVLPASDLRAHPPP